jgi:hypothetical protein
MKKLSIVFASTFYDDLHDRPGAGLFEQQDGANRRLALEIVMDKLASGIAAGKGPFHLRADVLEEPIHVRRLFKPAELKTLLVCRDLIVRVPSGDGTEPLPDDRYVVSFQMNDVRLGVLAGYVEIGDRPILVFLRAMETSETTELMDYLSRVPQALAKLYESVEKATKSVT